MSNFPLGEHMGQYNTMSTSSWFVSIMQQQDVKALGAITSEAQKEGSL